VKTIPTVVEEISDYLNRGWHLDGAGMGANRWPKAFTLGTVTSAEADRRWTDVVTWAHGWHDWARAHRLDMREESRRIRGVVQHLPTHITVADVDTAARAAGKGWPARLEQARDRADIARSSFAGADTPVVLKLAAPLGDVDFHLACTAARWFADHPDVWPGLTPRQVPVEGLHGKWLNKHRALVQALAGIDNLVLAVRPTRIYWTYLDPDYRRSGGRVHDSLTLGDHVSLPYKPSIVALVENKDTAVLFPPMSGAIAVEGNGNAAPGLLPQVPWIAGATTAVYWGDMDAAGYEIVDRLRARMPQLATVLMNRAAYEQYERYGTSVDERGNALKVGPPKPCPNLTPDERAVYEKLTDPAWTRHRRIEQERIPLSTALANLRELIRPTRTDTRAVAEAV
jgi:hypothetical protein